MLDPGQDGKLYVQFCCFKFKEEEISCQCNTSKLTSSVSPMLG